MHNSINHNIYNVDDNLDASDNVISGNEPSSDILTSQSQKTEMSQNR